MNLKSNTILITGGTSGIGYILAKELKAKGNKVILLGSNPERIKALKSKGFETINCDLTNQSDIENAAMRIQQKYPGLNVLFNNAGIQYNYLISDNIIPLDKINREVDINFTGQAKLTHLLLPILENKEKAYIINTTSALGAFPKTDGLIYSASKAAMRNFTIGLRYALAKTSIKVIEFIPPVTATPMTEDRDEKKMDPAKLIQTILPQIERDKSIVTIKKVRFFLWLSVRFPRLANKILSK